MDQAWFDMDDQRRPRIPTASWLPLRARHTRARGELWKPGCDEEHFGAVAILLPADRRDEALSIGWADVGHHAHTTQIDDEHYIRVGTFTAHSSDLTGQYPVLHQHFDVEPYVEWHLDQDIVFALGLSRERDSWVAPAEDYVEVARLKRAPDGRPELFEIRAEQLRDYLCARQMGLLVTTYRSRRAVFLARPPFNWTSSSPRRDLGGGRWEGCVNGIDESGSPYGSQVAILTASRCDSELEDDVPVLGPPSGENINVTRGAFQRTRDRAVFVSGELWRNEWVEPGSHSPRVRGDRTSSTVSFVIESDGTAATASGFGSGIRWLWFHPRVILDVLQRRGGSLEWFTEDTGCVSLASHSPLHFGINELGLINILAADIAQLPEHVQKLWASHNRTPEGGVSRELISSQMEVNPCKTTAPEDEFRQALAGLQEISNTKFASPLLQTHSQEEQIRGLVHRFQCVENAGTLRLCKEITRLVVDRIDIDLLKRLRPSDGKELGSIKRLERLLSDTGTDGRRILAPLVGTYELRHADAHLPSSELESAYSLVGVHEQMTDIERGKQIIRIVSETLQAISCAIDNHPGQDIRPPD
jgi:hypothetical protein